MRSLVKIAAILFAIVLAGCGGGDVAGIENNTSNVATSVEKTPEYGWNIVLSKLVLQQPPKGPTTGSLRQVEGSYVALPSDIIVPSVIPTVITRGGSSITYVASNIATGKTIVFPDNIELLARFKLAPGTYKFTAKIGDYETKPVCLIVLAP